MRGELIQCPFHGLGFGADGRYPQMDRQFYAPSSRAPAPEPEPVRLEGLETKDATAC